MKKASFQPKISILIPSLNAGKTIGETLRSIRSQTYKDYGVLILDGQSADATVKIANAYEAEDERFCCFVAKDSGIYDAMNKAIGQANGEWLYFLGSDDALFDNDVLQRVANAIQQDPAARLVYGNVQLSKLLGYHHQGLTYAGEFDAEKLLRKNICHQSAFYHRSLFTQFGLYNTTYPVFADYDFNLHCFNRVPSLYLNTLIAHFAVGGTSSAEQNRDQRFFDDFLENMAVRYAYRFSDAYFVGRKKELLRLFIKNTKRINLYRSAKLLRILAWQAFRGQKLLPTIKLSTGAKS